ncbi:MAG TPA: META domain-containing protein [Anaerolineales bacterium]|nr:META domain-containing protein [Anaerolineales bacterium]
MKAATLCVVAFAVIASACAPSLPGGGELTIPSQWTLVSLGPQGEETTSIEGSPITIELGPDGTVSGSAGCNSFGGAFELQGSTLTFKDVSSTLMACSDESVTQLEQQFLEALRTAIRFELTGESLTIWYGDGQSKLELVRLQPD